ncbi:unnamed protein product [Schistocephalus solidus]|uniref:Transposase n=1 Tax=Schistocephalus solidus TaxID=70667 RepID=A0A183SNQ8_SCHSO|nr:unnamed protein product [Schistocephalus solidus]
MRLTQSEGMAKPLGSTTPRCPIWEEVVMRLSALALFTPLAMITDARARKSRCLLLRSISRLPHARGHQRLELAHVPRTLSWPVANAQERAAKPTPSESAPPKWPRFLEAMYADESGINRHLELDEVNNNLRRGGTFRSVSGGASYLHPTLPLVFLTLS